MDAPYCTRYIDDKETGHCKHLKPYYGSYSKRGILLDELVDTVSGLPREFPIEIDHSNIKRFFRPSSRGYEFVWYSYRKFSQARLKRLS